MAVPVRSLFCFGCFLTSRELSRWIARFVTCWRTVRAGRLSRIVHAKGQRKKLQMNFKPKTSSFNPAVLPMEYLPRVLDAADEQHARHYLIPGKIFAAAQPFAISTIVGSGVALCLWDSAHHIGGANHFIFPDGPS